jgi:hypothetical protein
MSPPGIVLLTVALTLEGSAYCIGALLRVVGTYVNISRCAIAFAVVINAILYRAVNALDMLLAFSHFTHNYDRSL